jgi:hypothetical protein
MNIRWPWKKAVVQHGVVEIKPPEIDTSDESRVASYIASGGEIVDLSNKDRLPNDGFASDGELMQPWNQAHTGTKRGLASLAKGDRR